MRKIHLLVQTTRAISCSNLFIYSPFLSLPCYIFFSPNSSYSYSFKKFGHASPQWKICPMVLHFIRSKIQHPYYIVSYYTTLTCYSDLISFSLSLAHSDPVTSPPWNLSNIMLWTELCSLPNSYVEGLTN